jgi:hypothetical protein
MKPTTFLTFCFTLLCNIITNAQVQSAQMNNQNKISFTVAKEANVSYYVIEGSNDSIHYNFVQQIPSKGNSVLPVKYTVSFWKPEYRYLRIRQQNMNQQITYAAVQQPFFDNNNTAPAIVSK